MITVIILFLSVDKNNSRIQINGNVLSIKDIDYGDRKKFVCVGKVGDVELQQILILRVKGKCTVLIYP